MHRHVITERLSAPPAAAPSFRTRTAALALLLALAIPLSAPAQEPSRSPGPGEVAAAQSALLAEFPGARVDDDGFGRISCSGVPIGGAATRDEAAEAWLARHAALLGLLAADLELISVTPLSDPRATVYAYRIWSGAIPIEGGAARLVVRDLGERGPQVVYAGVHAARWPDEGYPAVRVAAAQALAAARAALQRPLLRFSEPELVIEPSATRRAPSRLVWHVRAQHAQTAGIDSWTVVVDPVTGIVLEVRDELLDVDVTGSVSGFVNPPNEPNTPLNPPVSMALGGVRVRVVGGSTVFSGPDGSFTIPHGGTAPVTVEASLAGQWVEVIDASGPEELVTQAITPPGPASLVFDAAGDPLIQAQVNAFRFVTTTHDFVRDRTTGIAGIDIPLECNVNINDLCNANFDPFAININFFLAGGGCVNTAFSSVVAHEYGHFIVDSLGVAQNAFGEGFGDVVSMLQFDDPIIGRDFTGPGTWVRNPVAANVQYPCNGSVHFCGQLLGGVWWDIREGIGAVLGPDGLAESQQLFIDWSLITLGGIGDSSAHPQTAVEVLTADDDDGLLLNGTPNYQAICAGFDDHSVDCPAFASVLISFPLGRPSVIPPGAPYDLRVDIEPGTANPVPGGASLLVRADGASGFTPVALQPLGGVSYSALIPPQSCGGEVEYYIEADHDAGGTTTHPTAGPLAPFTASIFEVLETVFEDDFEGSQGWTAGALGDTATAGTWTRVAPNGTAAAPGADHSDPGSQCFVTGQGIPGGGLGAADVDGGTTTLLSPVLDLSAPGDYSIRYWRWFSNDSGAQPNTEVFTVSLSGNGGQTWSTVEVVGPFGAENSGGWFLHEFQVADILAPTSSMRLRFVAADPDPGSLVEAAVDDVEVIRRLCDVGPTFRRGDVNGDQTMDLSDAVSILFTLFGTGSIGCIDAADTNDDGAQNIVDAVVLLEHLFVTGAPLPAPSVLCGEDPTSDPLDCAVEPACP